MQNSVPETQKRTRAKKGGSMSDVATHTTGLVVPWAILLAKQALQGVLDKPVEEKVGVATSTKKSPAKKSPAAAKKKQSGGGCSSCAAASSTSKKTVKGGSSDQKQSKQKNEYNELASKIQDFLSRY